MSARQVVSLRHHKACSGCTRTRVIRNAIAGKTLGNVGISEATGLTYVP